MLRRMSGSGKGRRNGENGVRLVDNGNFIAKVQLCRLGHGAQPELVAAQILQHRNRPIVSVGRRPYIRDHFSMLFQRAVGEVETCDVPCRR